MVRTRVLSLALAAVVVAGVLALSANQVSRAALLPDSRENTSAIAQNNGNAAATIAMNIYTPAGVLVGSASQVFNNVPVGGTRVFAQAINTGLPVGFRGVGVIESDQPVNALLVRDIESFGGVGSYSIHNAFPTGANTMVLPYVANALDGSFNTRVAIANTGAAVACVTMKYAFVPGYGSTPGTGRAAFNDAGPGGGGCSSGYPIPVGGQISFAPNNVDGATPFPGATANTLMAATLTSTGSTVTAAVDAYVTNQRKLASYDGFVVAPGQPNNDVGTNISVPLSLKTPDGYYSQILVANPNASQATVTITYTGSTGTHTKQLTVNGEGVETHSVYSDGTVPVGFVGAARVTSNQPVAVVLFRAKMTTANSFVDEDLYTAANGVPAERATQSAKFPLIFRRAYQAGSADGYNSWVSVAVADGTSANVTINAVNDPTSGAPGCNNNFTSVATKQVQGSFIFYQNLDAENGLTGNPACFWGGMTITADKPIIAIANVTTDLRPGDNDGTYNAFAN